MADRNREGKLVCIFCGKTFDSPMLANAHEQTNHEILHIKVEKGELIRLVQLIYKYASLEPGLIPVKLISRLNKYLRHKPEVINYSEFNDLS